MKRKLVFTHALVAAAAIGGTLGVTALASTTQDCQTFQAESVQVCVSSTATSSSTTTVPSATTTTTRPPPTTTVPPTTTTTTAPAPPAVGSPADVGLTIPASALKPWTGPTTITPTTAGVVNGTVSGYSFASAIRVSGPVAFSNDLFAFKAPWHIIVSGSAPGPTFTHIEIDGQNCTTACTSPNSNADDDGFTNSSRDNGMTQGVSVSPFTLDHSYLHNLINGMRLDSGATVTNTLVNKLWVYGGSHSDVSEIYCGSNIKVDHSTFDATAPAGQPLQSTNSATEQQGASGGFCPVSNVTWSNDILAGGGVTWRIDDTSVTSVTVRNVQVIAGSYEWSAFAVTNSASIRSWSGNSVVNIGTGTLTAVPAPSGGAWRYGCGVNKDCN